MWHESCLKTAESVQVADCSWPPDASPGVSRTSQLAGDAPPLGVRALASW